MRLSWPQYAMKMAETASLRSEDPYVKVGACVLGPDNSIASCGYNGAPPGINIDWSNRDERRKKVIHAEINALRYIRPGEGKLIAVTLRPCCDCLKNLVSYGILEVYFKEEYERDCSAYELAEEYGMKLFHLP